MITLSQIESSIYFQFRKRQFNSMDNRRVGIFHVSDYIQDCSRNSYYNHIGNKAKRSMDTSTMGIFFSGEAVHQLLDKAAPVGQGETGLAYDFVNDKKVNLFEEDGENLTDEWKNASPERWMQILIGEADSLYKLEIDGKKEWVIVDYKTWLSKGYKKKAASDDHKTQINAYKYLFLKAMGIDVKYGAVIYLDFADRMAKPLIFPFKIDDVEKIRVALLSKYTLFEETFKTGKLPPRVKSWKCDGYCPHAQRCMNEEELTKEENVLVPTL